MYEVLKSLRLKTLQENVYLGLIPELSECCSCSGSQQAVVLLRLQQVIPAHIWDARPALQWF